MSELNGNQIQNTNTALYTEVGENTGCSSKVGMEKVYRGGGLGYGVTMESLHRDATSGYGSLRPSRVAYSNCTSPQRGGNKNLGLSHPSLAETRFNHESAASYGYSNGEDVSDFKGSYAPITRNAAGQQCGGKRKKKKSRRKKKKSKRGKKKSRRKSRRGGRRKSRRGGRRKSKRKLPYCLDCKTCHKGKCKKSKKCPCKKSKKRRRRRRVQRGGTSVFYSGISDAIDNNSARLLGGEYRGNSENCGDNYNHYNKSTSDRPPLY